MVIRKSNHTQRIQWPMNKYYPFQAVTTKYTFCYMYLPMQLLYFCPLKSGIRDTYYRVQKANPTFNGVVQPDWIPFLWILGFIPSTAPDRQVSYFPVERLSSVTCCMCLFAPKFLRV